METFARQSVPVVGHPQEAQSTVGIWLSQKGINYVLNPARIRKQLTSINPDVCNTLTAKGQNNWIGTFVSPDIDFVEPGQETVIHLMGGERPAV